jgi:phage-related protein
MGEQIIGRVSVKVMPDTSDFRRDAERQLDRIEDHLEVTVATKIDITGAKRDLLEAVRKMNAENRSRDHLRVKLYTSLAVTDANEQITKAVRKFQARIDAEHRRVKIDADLVAADLKATLDEDSLDEVKRKIEHWRRKMSPIKIPVQLDLSQTANLTTTARIDVLTRPRKVSIIPDLDNAALAKVGTALAALSGARILSETFRDITEQLLRLDKSVPIIGTLALAVAGLASFALSAASNLAAMSVSLAQIIPAALVLPGIFGGLVIGLGTSIVALMDFKKRIPEVSNAFKELRTAISDDFWAKAEKPFRNFIDGLLPEFLAGVKQTAGELGGWFGNLATSITGAFNGLLAGMFDDLSNSINIAASGTNAFAGIIATLANVGTGYLPSLAKWFVDIATTFDHFLSAAASDGRLKGWIDTGITQLSILGGAFRSLYDLFGAIGTAAQQAGGSTLAMFAETLRKVADVAASPAFQTGLIKTLQGAHKAIQDLTTGAGPGLQALFTQISDVLATVLPVAGQAIGSLLGALSTALSDPEIANGVIMMFNGLKAGVDALAPAFGPLTQALAQIAKLVGTMAASFGPLIAAAVVPLANTLGRLAPALQPFVELLSGTLTSVLKTVTPVFEQLAAQLIGVLQSGGFTGIQAVIEGLLPAVQALGQVFGQVLAPVFAQLGPVLAVLGKAFGQIFVALAPLITALGGLIAAILPPLVEILSGVLLTVIPQLANAITYVVEAITPFIGQVAAVAQVLMAVLAPILTWVLETLGSRLVTAITAVGQIITGFVSIIQGLWDILSGIFTGDWSKLWTGVQEVFSGAWDAIVGGIKFHFAAMIAFVKSAFSLLSAAFVGAWNAIKAATVAVWEVMKVAWSTFLATLKAAPGAALETIKGIFSTAWNALSSAAKAAWHGLVTIVQTEVNGLKAIVVDLPKKIVGWLGDLGGILKDAGKKIIQGLIDGIGSMFDSVKNKLGELTGWLPDWKGPEEVDRTVLFNAGRLVIGGFLDGLESMYAEVHKSLRSFTAGISDTNIDPLKVKDSGGLTDKLRAIADGADPTGIVVRQFVYNAAPNNSLPAEEDFLNAATRERAGW